MTDATTGAPPPPTAATVRVGGAAARALPDDLQARVLRAVVDSRTHLPAMVEITFRDDDADILDRTGITFGSRIEVWTDAGESGEPALVGAGEVTAVEGEYVDLSMITVVRAYDAGHRLQRRSRVRTFENATDSDIARRVAREAGLRVGRVEPTRTSHRHIGQLNQTDWDFLTWRCQEIGYEFGVAEDGFFFRPVAGARDTPIPLELQRDLWTFRPRVTAGNMAPEVELRAWDPLEARVVSTTVDTAAHTADLDGTTVSEAVRGAAGSCPPAPPPAGDPSRGPAATANGHIVTGTLPAVGAALGAATREAVQGPAGRLGGSFAEAQGIALGDPRLRAGAAVRVAGAPPLFSGTWTVAAAQHVFDALEGGYRTRLQLGSAEDRTLLGLTAGAAGASAPGPRAEGLMCGVVTDVNDPEDTGRVRVSLPWLDPSFVTDWAPVVQAGGGRRAGAMLLPDVDDQVLLGFELGDSRRPYVVGGVLSKASDYRPAGPAVEATGHTAEVVRRGIVSPSGNMLAFHDKMPPSPQQPPTASAIVLGTRDASLGLAIDQVAGTLTLTCRPRPPDSKAAAGRLHIDCGDGGTVEISAGQGGNVSIDGGASLSLRAQSSISIESTGTVAIKGSTIELN
ncbi:MULTISPECIES: VgrG-related protein [unclassified Streptomyces]|uniref:VgrG-related protein n=1 Tax=unclassified Streptomyces TaxID=2593676 RepID=UPI00101BB7BD|nr:VgrG-related protein [Streptomyces sp. L-9-10]RYJ19983.1 VgrG protein [Streptomyces sp. L-9-10]